MDTPAFQSRSFACFALVATGVYSLCALFGAGILAAEGRPHLPAMGGVGGALGVDLIVTLPVLFWWFLFPRERSTTWWSRSGGSWAVLAIIATGWLVAGWLLPHASLLEIVTAPWTRVLAASSLGAAALYFLGWLTETDQVSDPVHRAKTRLTEVLGDSAAARALARAVGQACTVPALGLASWRHGPCAPRGAMTFGQHKRSLHGEMLLGLLLASSAEVIAMHFLVARWHPGAAWCLTALSLYGSLWLIADYRAAVLRPVLVERNVLRVRAGLRFEVDVPLTNVRGISSTRPDAKGIAMTLISEPEAWIELREPLTVRGPYGIRMEVATVGLTVDRPEEFAAALAPHG